MLKYTFEVTDDPSPDDVMIKFELSLDAARQVLKILADHCDVNLNSHAVLFNISGKINRVNGEVPCGDERSIVLDEKSIVFDGGHGEKTVAEMKSYSEAHEFHRMMRIRVNGMKCPCGCEEIPQEQV